LHKIRLILGWLCGSFWCRPWMVAGVAAGSWLVGFDSWAWRFVCLVSPSVAVLPVAPCLWLRLSAASVGRCSSCGRGGSCRGRVARSGVAHGWLQGGGWFVACRPRFVGVAVRVPGVAIGGGAACHPCQWLRQTVASVGRVASSCSLIPLFIIAKHFF